MTRPARQVQLYQVEPQVHRGPAEITVLEVAPARRRRPLGWVFWVVFLLLLISSSILILWHMIGAVSIFYTYQHQGGPTYSVVQWSYASQVQEVSELNVFDVIANFHPAVVKVSQR